MHPARRGRTRKSPDLTSPANRPTQAGVHARTTSSNICPHCTQLIRRHRVRHARRAAAVHALTVERRSASPASAGPRTVRAARVAPAPPPSAGKPGPSSGATLLNLARGYIPRSLSGACLGAGAHAQVRPGREARRRRPASSAAREVRHRAGGNASRRARAILVQAQRDAGRPSARCAGSSASNARIFRVVHPTRYRGGSRIRTTVLDRVTKVQGC